jgi:hypothetical protein
MRKTNCQNFGRPGDVGPVRREGIAPLTDFVAALGGGIASGQVIAPGPGHSAKDRSLAVKLEATAPWSHAGDDWQACRDHVTRRLGLDRDAWMRTSAKAQSTPVPARPLVGFAGDNREKALALWRPGRRGRGARPPPLQARSADLQSPRRRDDQKGVFELLRRLMADVSADGDLLSSEAST